MLPLPVSQSIAPFPAAARHQADSRSPAVSILVTVYNREKYLAACLESVLASTWQDFEVIVVDDASTDSSMSIAESFRERDARVRVFRNETTRGDYPNRMRAAEVAQGRYLKYVDSDDVIYPHGLAIMVESMEAHPDAALGISHSLPEDEQPYPWKLTPSDAWRKEFLGPGCLASGPTGAIIRRESFFETGGFRDWGVLSDTDLWYRLSARWPVVLLPPGLVWWRRHEGQEFSLIGANVVYLEKGFALTMEALSSTDCPLDAAERQSAGARARQHHSRRLISLALRRGHPLLAMRLIARADLSVRDVMKGLSRYK